MITDEELREIAEELRIHGKCEGFEDCTECQALSMKLFGDKWVLCQLDERDANYWKALADLIDRPTCRIILARELRTAYGKPITGINGYILSCGHQAVGFEKPRYCPECGMEVGE